MSFRDLVLRTRTIRRFRQDRRPSLETLRGLIDLARCAASAGNMQPLKFILSTDPDQNARIFPFLRWAAYLTGWSGPSDTERATAYIVILQDTHVAPSLNCDHGIAAQTILLGAAEAGLGGCIVGSVEKEGLGHQLSLPDHLQILLVLALGSPAEEVRLETVRPDHDVRYWRDADGIHHVPKRSLDEIIVAQYGNEPAS